MKVKSLLIICGALALMLSAGNVFAQDDNGNGTPGGNNNMRRNGGNFDPAQFQQRIMGHIQDQLGFTNDTDWSAVQPLVQKVLDAQRDARGPGMGRLFSRNRGGNNNNNNRPSLFGQSSPEADALQNAIDQNAPSSQIKQLLSKYRDSQKLKMKKLTDAQSDLKNVLTVKQEAQATLLGLLD